ncbi:unnamed protein product [Mytilus coruscus]|uniref:MYND-type domain-containing protein n=1 Tax=Mytilus coruscus TaxID=42192 RepID=A0A6J8EIV4_MYTCO|nr:unnamed protein product [Mytilus coruscus]
MESQTLDRACFVCGKGEAKRCSSCKQVLYCSKKCQKADWKTHKTMCVKTDENANYNEPHVNRPLVETDNLPKIQLTSTLYDSAKTKTKNLFPGKDVLCSLDDLSPAPRFDAVFLAYIAGYHPYVFRHAIFILDINRKESFLTFYLDYDKPEPYFTWEDVRPGKFVAIQLPHLHYFMDGQVGFRIEEPYEVRFLDG